MKTLFTFAAFAFAVCVVGTPQYAAAQWPEATSHEPRVTVEFGGIAFDREGESDTPLSVVDTVTTADLLSTDEASDLGSAAGIQGRVIFPAPRTLQTLEFRGSVVGWEEETSVVSDTLESTFFLAGIFQVEDLLNFDPTVEPVNPVLPVGVTTEDLAQPTIPLTTAFDGDVSTLSLVWPGLPPGIFADGISPPSFLSIFDVDDVETRYDSDYYSLELMSRRNTNPGVTWLFGPRFVSVTEDFEVTANGSSPSRIFSPPIFDPVTGDVLDFFGGATEDSTAAVRTETRNSLIGLQLGLEYNFPITQNIYLQATGRGGIYLNSATADRLTSPLRQRSSQFANDFTTLTTEDDTSEAYLAEFSARAYGDIIPNRLSAYAGYEVLYIDNIALAPNQSVIIDSVDQDSELFARGFSFGMQMNF